MLQSAFTLQKLVPSFVNQFPFYEKLPESFGMFWKLQVISLPLFLW